MRTRRGGFIALAAVGALLGACGGGSSASDEASQACSAIRQTQHAFHELVSLPKPTTNDSQAWLRYSADSIRLGHEVEAAQASADQHAQAAARMDHRYDDLARNTTLMRDNDRQASSTWQAAAYVALNYDGCPAG